MEDITDADQAHAKRVPKDFNIKKHHDFHVQRNILTLADVFENFRNMSLEKHELYQVYFLTVPGLASQAALRIH